MPIIEPEDLIEYMWLRPDKTSLAFDIFVDDGGAYMRWNRPLILLVRNGHGRGCTEFIPITVSDKPEILDSQIQIVIPDCELERIYQFIVDNQRLLKSFADGEITVSEFSANLVTAR